MRGVRAPRLEHTISRDVIPLRLAPFLLLAACVPVEATFEVRSVDTLVVRRVEGERAELVLGVRVLSRAPVDARVQARSYDVTLAGASGPAGGGRATAEIAVPAGGQVVLELPFELELGRLPPELPRLLAAGGVPYRARVELAIRSSVGDLEREVKPEGVARLGDGFQLIVDGAFSGHAVRVVGLERPQVGLGWVTLRPRLAVTPLLPFPVQVRALRYQVRLDGATVGGAETREGFRVAPGAPVEIVLPLRVSLLGLGEAARAALAVAGGRALEVVGEVEIDPIGPVTRVPFRVDAKVTW